VTADTTTIEQGADPDTIEDAPVSCATDGAVVISPGARKMRPGGGGARKSWFERIESYLSRLSSRSNFWHRVCSLIWLPIAFRSGIKVRRLDTSTFTAVLPFRRFNRNWYNAMAGAALLANSEIAGGMYVFGVCGGDYTVVCKELRYRFLRPCHGPALYKVTPLEDVEQLVAKGGEFNIDVELDILQQIKKPSVGREHRVGKCLATFHVTPKDHAKRKKVARRMKQRERGRRAGVKGNAE
jgi:hypothetical protein